MTISKIIFQELHFEQLKKLVFDKAGVEGAAFVLCGQSKSTEVNKLISHAVIPIADEDYLRRSPDGLTIGSRALVRITKLARYENLSIIFAHSHPGGWCHFSEQDDREEEKLFPFFQIRVPNRIHGSVVITEDHIVGRLYSPHQSDVDFIVSIGSFYQILRSTESPQPAAAVYDRQVRAFGVHTQAILRGLRVGIVGLGGTGSPLCEQLYRLGVGQLILIDPDTLSETNLNRVYGTGHSDVGREKVVLAATRLRAMGLGPETFPITDSIKWEDCAQLLATCDVVFGCTDKQLPRAILTKLAIQYCIPVFDTGVLIDSKAGEIRGVVGRITTLLPGESCLFCRGRISAEGLRIESLSESDRANQIRDGYAPELDEPAPAVIAFTSAVASLAVSELIHRLTKFMGAERLSTEVLVCFDETKLHRNRTPPKEACMCDSPSLFGRGDETPFLGLYWPTRPEPDNNPIS
jgi:hypothetical protein